MMRLTVAAGILAVVAGGASAATVTYDFKKEANASGQIGESIFDEFATTGNGVFTGPNLLMTATKDGDDAFVYFDNNNAGIGVCGVPSNPANVNNYNPGSGANQCNPAGDDGITTALETLHIEATQKLTIESIYINSNHDNDDADPLAAVLGTVWEFGGTVYDVADFVVESVSGTGDVRIDVNFMMFAGDVVTLEGLSGANSYLSAITVAPVPLPAGMALMLTGLGGFAAFRRRK